ncbi:MAG TPA: hypothetical protein VFI53_17645, partial [Myxococcaceae bacterium]|nr:hypothetical protein [Myxococcaceae bacterium]
SALENRTLDLAVLGGADSAYDAGEVQSLLDAKLLFDTEDPQTRIPGEAAAFLLLGRPELATSAGLDVWGAVEGASTDAELGPALSALTKPLKARRAQVDWLIGDVNNEPERVAAWTLAFPRAFSPGGLDTAGQDWAPTAADGLRAEFPAECFGDVGAAMLPTGAVLALEAGRRGDPPARRVLLGCCDPGLSGGALINVEQRQRGR